MVRQMLPVLVAFARIVSSCLQPVYQERAVLLLFLRVLQFESGVGRLRSV
jgi:hypothetical protein